MADPNEYSLWIKDANGVVLFKLASSKVSIPTRRAVENFEIPGLSWNDWFDSRTVNCTWTASGTIRIEDHAWDVSTYGYYGRPFDIKHQLSCVLNGIDATTGALLDGTIYCKLQLELHKSINGTEYTYNPATAFSGIAIYFNVDNFNIDIDGTKPNEVPYTIVFNEVSGVVPLG